MTQTAPVLERARGKKPVDWRRIVTLAGAILAFLIGSGFATGQEILQYFTSYGLRGVVGTGLVVMVLMIFVVVEFLTAGREQRFDRPSRIYRYYAGRTLGTFFDWFSILFIFMTFTVMISGAGAVFEQQYGLGNGIGAVVLASLAALTVWFGLSRLVDIIGTIGPVIVAIAVGLGLFAIVRDPAGITEGNAQLPTLDVTQASSNWFFSGLSYVGFNMLLLAAFLTAVGKSMPRRIEAVGGGVLGAGAFALACMVVALGLLANVAAVHDAQIPMLVLADGVSPLLAGSFSLIILAGIYTTAVPLLWTVSSRVFEDRSTRFRVLTAALATAGAFIGVAIPFDQMINIVYVINGYVGVLLLVLMIVRSVRRLVLAKEPNTHALTASEH